MLLVVRSCLPCELKGRVGVDSGYVLHCSLCKSEQWRVKRKNTKHWMRSMKKLLIFSGSYEPNRSFIF